jgi:hypothetical protein
MKGCTSFAAKHGKKTVPVCRGMKKQRGTLLLTGLSPVIFS